jgi:hypothetical protein
MTVTTNESEVTPGQRSAPLVIVSCDTHAGPRLVADLRPYCPRGLLSDFDAYAADLSSKRAAAAARREKVSFGGATV